MRQEASRPPWLDEVAGALERQLDARRLRDPRANRSGRFRLVGPAVRDPAAGPGWFHVDLRGAAGAGDRLDGARLAPERGPRLGGPRLLEAWREANDPVVRV